MKKTFSHHKPSEEGLSKMTTLEEAFSSLSTLIKETIPESRERSIALTNLETTAMWVSRSVVKSYPENVVE